MKHFIATCMILFVTPPALADPAARWVIGGTFATSGYTVNAQREDTYRGARREDKRLLSFLPGMTILYGGQPLADTSLGYPVVAGLTQSGIPVAISESDISRGDFSTRAYKDVVVHQSHLACRTPGCDEAEKIPVGIGYGFNILSEDEQGLFLENSDELRVHYRPSELDALERDGQLTRHKERRFPRIDIVEGYASEISMSCGETRVAGTTFSVPAAEMAMDPSDWDINSPAWSAKAVEIFDIGTLSDLGDMVEVQLATDIAHEEGEGIFALDFTVFAFKDAVDPAAPTQWAALYAIVKCNERALGSTQPAYVDSVWLANADGQRQLPQQLAVNQKEALSPLINRSFFYSFNSAQSYFNYFPALSSVVGNNHLAIFLISRLNATCASSKRSLCDEQSLYQPISDARPIARPGS